MAKYFNPVIRGFNPDPSICRVGKDFYIVTSTFEFFPGVPIYHSRNLADWELIGHCLTRASQLPLAGCRASGGIYAPTLRHHGGMFYMTTTNVSGGGNFIVHAEDIGGPWSEPRWVRQGGIDPSLTFDDDGVCYFQSTTNMGGRPGIYGCAVDPLTGGQLSDSVLLTPGWQGRHPEAPHMYKIGGMYYLMIAEGGTSYGHMVTMFRGAAPYGPFEPCPHNPILTHRDRNAQDSPIQCTGHADITQDQNGGWWMVALGVRQLPGNCHHNLGRETFLAPLRWEDDGAGAGWPVVGDGGTLALEGEAPLPGGEVKKRGVRFADDFGGGAFHPEYTFIRNPDMSRYSFTPGGLRMAGGGIPLCEEGVSPVFIGVRQKEHKTYASARVSVGALSKAGIAAYYTNEHHYSAYIRHDGEAFRACLGKRVYDMDVTVSVPVPCGEALIEIEADTERYAFYVTPRGGERMALGTGAIQGLCTEVTRFMTFTGVFLGVFCEYGEATVRRLEIEY